MHAVKQTLHLLVDRSNRIAERKKAELIECEMCAQAEEARQREVGAGVAERDRRSAELREQLENDAAILRRAQKAVDAERATQKVSPT